MEIAPFFELIAGGNLDAVRERIEENPFLVHVRNPDAEAWRERTPLHAAARHGSLEIAELLVESGAEVYSNPHATYPPVIIAAWHKQQPLVDYFLNDIPEKANGTNGIGVAINLAAREGWTDVVRRHIEADPLSVHQRGWIGDTPMHWPAHNGFVEILEMLLDAGAEIEADEINCYGGKPLHWASESQPAAVECLLRHGALVDSRNERKGRFLGFTPLIMNAVQKDETGDVAELLIRAGADVNAVDALGKTALNYALEAELTKLPEVLRAHGAKG